MSRFGRLVCALKVTLSFDNIRMATEKYKRDNTRQCGCCGWAERDGAEDPNARLDLVLELTYSCSLNRATWHRQTAQSFKEKGNSNKRDVLYPKQHILLKELWAGLIIILVSQKLPSTSESNKI